MEAAAHAICFQVWLASSLLADALALAAQALISQSRRRRPRHAAHVARRALMLGCVLGGCLGAALLLLRGQIAAAFTSDPGTRAVAARLLVWVALLQPVNAQAFVWDGVLYGASAFRCGRRRVHPALPPPPFAHVMLRAVATASKYCISERSSGLAGLPHVSRCHPVPTNKTSRLLHRTLAVVWRNRACARPRTFAHRPPGLVPWMWMRAPAVQVRRAGDAY